MNPIQVTEKFSISEQITEGDIATLADSGVKIIICNRPDGEEPNQISCATIKSAAEKRHIKFLHMPVAGREIPMDVLYDFVDCIEGTNEKIHAYCRTGTRSSIFWGLAQARSESVDQVLAKAQALGLNLTPVRDQLEAVYKINH